MPPPQLQWSNESNAGFTNGSSTWLPVNPNYHWLNLANQVEQIPVYVICIYLYKQTLTGKANSKKMTNTETSQLPTHNFGLLTLISF